MGENSGFFNSNTPEKIRVFNKYCDRKLWDSFEKPSFLYQIQVEEWINFDLMTDDEKKEHPKAFGCDGYLKTISYKEAWKNAFNSASKEDIELLKKLPNFDVDVFEEISGIRL